MKQKVLLTLGLIAIFIAACGTPPTNDPVTADVEVQQPTITITETVIEQFTNPAVEAEIDIPIVNTSESVKDEPANTDSSKLADRTESTTAPASTTTPVPTTIPTPISTPVPTVSSISTTNSCSSHVVNGAVNVRTGAGTAYPVQASLSVGTRLHITGYFEDWYQIDLENQDLWLYSDYVDTNCDVSYTNDMPPVPAPPPTPTAIVVEVTCHSAYESLCLPVVDDLDCDDFSEQSFSINPSNDPYDLDRDNDGIA